MSGTDRLRHRHATASSTASSPSRRRNMTMDNNANGDTTKHRHHHHGSSSQQHDYNDDDTTSTSSYMSNNSSGSNSRRGNKSSSKIASPSHDLGHIDEEHGYDQRHNYEMTSLVGDGKGGGGGGSRMSKHSQPKLQNNKKYKLHLKSGAGGAADEDEDDNDDVRSRMLLLKSAFWISCWYGTSLATLFLNKIILSRPGSSVHVLGMCQMTTAAVLGGWSAFGGADYVYGAAMFVWKCVPDVVQCKLGLGGGNNATMGKGGEHHHDENKRHHHHNLDAEPSKSNPQTASATATTGGGSVGFHFVRDMSIVGVLRGLTVVLGLIALEHVPVSFVETIKATAPAFTVVFARLILAERTATPVMLTLIPVVAGLILCSASELRFDAIGFVAAVMNNCADCVQNVMSKRMLAHLKPTQLQFYTSVAALALQAPFVLRDATGLIRKWAAHRGVNEDVLVAVSPEDEDGSLDHGMSLTKLLIIDAIFYHLQSVSAYCTMGCMSPVSQSVANTLKRALLVWASILYFGNPVTNSGIVGIIMVVSGVFLYNHVRRIHQS